MKTLSTQEWSGVGHTRAGSLHEAVTDIGRALDAYVQDDEYSRYELYGDYKQYKVTITISEA